MALSISVFVVLVVAAFVWLSRTVPQASHATTGPLDMGGSPEELAEAGRAIFERENSCLTCHSIGDDPKARCPNLEQVWTRAATRRPGMSGPEYLVQSVYDPRAYVVEGYPKNQMQPVNRPPIGLSDDEIKAVLCYLVSLSGELNEDHVRAIEAAQGPYRRGEIAVAQALDDFAWPEGDPEEGEFVFAEMKCLQCHVVFGKGGSDSTNIGPDLSRIGSIQVPKYLYESIISPSAVIVRGEGYTTGDGESKMPEYHDTMTLRSLIDVVAYLATLTGPGGDTLQSSPTEGGR